MGKIYVIFNPAARGEKSRRVRELLEHQQGAAVTLAPTSGPGEARHLAERAVAEGYELIVAAGGDGTINEVINGFGRSAATLGVLPAGTVNVFAREMGIPRNLAAAWRVLEAGATRRIDLAKAEAQGQVRYFVQLAGVGFDAWAVQHASWQLKKKIGPLSYVWAGLKAVRFPCAPVEVQVVDGMPPARGVVALIGNGRYYGGRFAVFPRARMDDGLLDVCVFERGGYWDVVRYAQAVLRGVHTQYADVRYFQAKRLQCRADGNAPFEVDGELAGQAPVEFSVAPQALQVLVPRTAV